MGIYADTSGSHAHNRCHCKSNESGPSLYGMIVESLMKRSGFNLSNYESDNKPKEEPK